MAGPSTSSPILERGKACLRCRRRKMRCDGARPACAQCARSHIDDCEYTDGGPTQSQLLEQNIAHLEARIRELEGSDAAVTLHDPHAANNPPAPVDSAQTTERIIQAFLDHAGTFGFFLHREHFLHNLRASIPHTDASPLPASLVHATHLIGLVCTNDPALKQEEPHALSRALLGLSASLDPAHVIYTLQAEVLLTYYLFHQGRILEGGYHAAAAASIAVACRLHKIGGFAGLEGAAPAGADVFQLPPPADAVAEGERIRAFWTVFVLDRYWSVWAQAPSALVQEAAPAMQVDTPWPLEMAAYAQNVIPQGATGAQTVLRFLRGLTTESPYQSLLALRAKAAALYEWAVRVAASWDPHSAGAFAQLQALDGRIDRFTQMLPRLDALPHAHPARVRDLLVTYALCYGATLQLHAPKDQPLDTGTSKTVMAANAVADVLRLVDVPRLHFVDPIMGVLLGLAGQVLVASLVSIRQANTVPVSPALAVAPAEIIVIGSLNRVLDAMFALRENSPLINDELTKLRASMTQNQAGVL